ncbi:MAG: hypothetical protein ACQEP1_06005 [Nanobdellota archaeon]
MGKALKRLVMLGLLAGGLYLADKHNIPSRMIEKYNDLKGSKEQVEEKVKKPGGGDYDKMMSMYESLPDKKKENFLYHAFSDKPSVNTIDSLFDYVSTGPYTSEEKVNLFGGYYQNLSNKERWKAAKEITKRTLR